MSRMSLAARATPVLSLLTLLALFTAACGPSYVAMEDFPDEADGGFIISDEAKIKDDEENLAILRTVARYRRGMIERNPAILRPLVSASYYENASTTDDSEDDYGAERLDDLFADLQETVQEVRYNIKIVQLLREPNELAHVDYEYVYRMRIRVDGREHWDARHDVNRLTLVREDDQWKIAGGM